MKEEEEEEEDEEEEEEEDDDDDDDDDDENNQLVFLDVLKRLESFIGSGAVADKTTTSAKPEDSSEGNWSNTLQRCDDMTPALKLQLIRRRSGNTFKFEEAKILATGDNRVGRELLELWFTGPQYVDNYDELLLHTRCLDFA
nr:unnamed protein product [Spirometra erinaceieuropaei]